MLSTKLNLSLLKRSLTKNTLTLSKRYTTKTKEEIKSKVLKYNMKTCTMGFPDNYGKFIGKKYDSDYFVDKVLKNGSNCCNYILSSDMDNDPIPAAKIASFQRGFGDFQMVPDFDSYREINYVNNSKQILLFADLKQDGVALQHAPRTLLRTAVSNLEKLGLSVEAHCGINFTVFNEKFRKNQENLHDVEPINQHCNEYNFLNLQVHDELLNKFTKSLRTSDVNVESIWGERTPGQYRVNLGLTKDLVEFSDNIVLLKLITKKIADDNEKSLSYIAKHDANVLGNSMNLKLVIKDSKTGANIFENSGLADSAQAGIMKHILDLLVFYCPNVNSYKRLKECDLDNNWNKVGAMTENNGLNHIKEDGVDKLLFRLPGADANPYLALYALLTSVADGVSSKLKLNQTLESLKSQSLPINLSEAHLKYKNSEFALRSLGEDAHYNFAVLFDYEFSIFTSHVDDWEVRRYFYNI